MGRKKTQISAILPSYETNGAASYQLIREGGKEFLFNRNGYSIVARDPEKLHAAYKSIRETLAKYEYPTGVEWIKAIATGGSDALLALIKKELEERIKELKPHKYIADAWRKCVVEEAPRDLFLEADTLHSTIQKLRGDLPIADDEITFSDGGAFFDVETIKERVRNNFKVEITPQIQEEAKLVREAVKIARNLADGGLNATDVVCKLSGNWLAPSKRPDLSDKVLVYQTIIENRHKDREQIKKDSPEWYYLNGGE